MHYPGGFTLGGANASHIFDPTLATSKKTQHQAIAIILIKTFV
jgi:hypothetical protein